MQKIHQNTQIFGENQAKFPIKPIPIGTRAFPPSLLSPKGPTTPPYTADLTSHVTTDPKNTFTYINHLPIPASPQDLEYTTISRGIRKKKRSNTSLPGQHKRSYRSYLQEMKYSRPATVDHVARPHPHVNDEDHEVAMVVVAYTIEHPCCTDNNHVKVSNTKLPTKTTHGQGFIQDFRIFDLRGGYLRVCIFGGKY